MGVSAISFPISRIYRAATFSGVEARHSANHCCSATKTTMWAFLQASNYTNVRRIVDPDFGSIDEAPDISIPFCPGQDGKRP
jgi:hypothetical protein